MPHHTGFRIILFQSLYQAMQSFLLFRCTGIFRPIASIESAFVADADAVGIVTRGMCAHRIEGTPGMNHTVAGDVVVIADVGKATGTVVTTAVVHGVTLRGTGGTTMNHYQIDATVVLVLAAVQDGIAHKAPQACRPKVVATAVSTVMTIFKILLQMLVFSMMFDI